MNALDFFLSPGSIAQKQYEALRMFYVENKTAREVAEAFGYTHRGFTSIITDFKKKLSDNDGNGLFFKPVQKGRKTTEKVIGAQDIVVELRKSYHSVEEIKVVLDGKGIDVSERTIYDIILDLERYSHISDQSLFDKFILNTADIEIENDTIKVFLKKKRNLPIILEVMQKFASKKYEWLNNLKLEFYDASYS